MSDTNPNTPPPVDEFRASIRTALGLAADADDSAITTALGNVTKERDEHKARADTVVIERNAERLDSALTAAFNTQSSIDKRNLPDFMALARPLFHIDEKGRVVTKGGETGEPTGLSPADWTASRLRSLRGWWYPLSQGGGAKSLGIPHDSLGDTSAFDPRSPGFSVTRQMQQEVERGARWADAARAKHRGHGGPR